MVPLSGLKVIDFSTLLPGPLASLMLAEAGADVLKIERPGTGDESRVMSAVLFAMLNRGKRSLALDLGSDEGRVRALELIRDADILIEQFRPGVMDRLGLGWEALRAVNPRLIYCSITGYGQAGPLADRAGHDLNYQAETGLLSACPGLPHVLVADIMGGAYPAALNVVMALVGRARGGQGCHLDVAMAENVFPALITQLAEQVEEGRNAALDSGFFLGRSPRYRCYETRDGRRMAVGAVENRFWSQLCEGVGLPSSLCDDAKDPAATMQALESLFKAKDAAHWQEVFAEKDACCSLVLEPEEALAHPHFAERQVFSRFVLGPAGEGPWPGLPLPVARSLRDKAKIRPAPALGEHDGQGWTGNV